eukprot:m51a1_g8842 hypothetical protein (1226) ;mRNA; r:444824-449552
MRPRLRSTAITADDVPIVPPACVNASGTIVIGQSVGQSQIEKGASEGLRVAVGQAQQLTALPIIVRWYNHTTEEELMINVKRLVEVDCAFAIAATTPTSVTEPSLLAYLKRYGVPLVGTMSASQDLRILVNNTASFLRGSSLRRTTLPFVVNVRASGTDELNAVLSVLAQDWSSLSKVALVAHSTPFGTAAYNYVNSALITLRGTKGQGLLNQVFLSTETMTDSQMASAMTGLFTNSPTTLIMCTTPATSAQVIKWLAHSGKKDMAVYLVSWVSGTDMTTRLDSESKALLDSNDVSMYFTQNMPNPTPASTWQSIPLIRRFVNAKTSYKSHSALEGYLVGWFIYEVAQQAVARNSLPLTRGDFLYTIFVDVRTFNVQGMKLGPYGDGGISGGTSTQSAEEACNQGVHDMYMVLWEPSNGSETHLAGATTKWAGCIAPQWTSSGTLTLVGSIDLESTASDTTSRSGLLGAVNDHNAEGDNTVLLRSMEGNLSGIASGLRDSKVVAVVSPLLTDTTGVSTVFQDVALISPLPGGIVNLFPSAYDEMDAAFAFLETLKVTKVAIIRNDDSLYTTQCIQALEHINDTRGVHPEDKGVTDAATWIRENPSSEFGAVLILGGTFNASKAGTASKIVRLLNSQVVSTGRGGRNNASSSLTYSLSVSPPLVYFATTSDLRTEYSTWVSSTDTDGTSFRSFFVGKFLGAVIDVAKNGESNKSVGAEELLKAVYKRSVFTVGGIQIGPFQDSCSKERECCNQGLNTVYVLSGQSTNQRVVKMFGDGDCGRKYWPVIDEASDDNMNLILGLAIGLGGGGLLCVLILTLVIWRASRTVEFFNIRKGEIELGKCLGNGRFGSMYMADWHGTTVAVRVIDKKATPKEDQRLIKEEVLLLHKHHHPNLLMLMGYCETKTELLVVTEYMEGGTLAEYLRKEKRYADVYSLVAMAFMDAKGTVKVSDFWFSSKKGAFSSSGSGKSLKKAAWQPPEVIAGTLLTPATDVYAFGIVLWEIIAPPDMTLTSSSASASASAASVTDSQSTSHSVPGTPVMSSGMMSAGLGGAIEMQTPQLGPPEIPPNASPEVAELLEKCWQSQPERRPSIFQILRSWPTTFAVRAFHRDKCSTHLQCAQTLGAFEVPQDLIPSVGSANAAGLFSHQSSGSGHNNPKNSEMSGDDMASMVGIMPLKMDSVALQMPQKIDAGGLAEVNQLAAEPAKHRSGSVSSKTRSRQGSAENNV